MSNAQYRLKHKVAGQTQGRPKENLLLFGQPLEEPTKLIWIQVKMNRIKPSSG